MNNIIDLAERRRERKSNRLARALTQMDQTQCMIFYPAIEKHLTDSDRQKVQSRIPAGVSNE